MIFCYHCEACGSTQERVFSIGQAPEMVPCEACGDPIPRDYATEKAGPASGQIANGFKYPYVSNRLPMKLDGCPHDKRGKSVILNPSHEREIMARYNYGRE